MTFRPIVLAFLFVACGSSPASPRTHGDVPYTIAIDGAPCIKLHFQVTAYGGGTVYVRDSVSASDSITFMLPDSGAYSGTGEMEEVGIGLVPGYWTVYAPGAVHFACE